MTMVRTLTLVTALALFAGLACGFFVSEARATKATTAPDAVLDPVVEQKVRLYREKYDLTTEQTQQIREALKDYDQGVRDLLLRLRAQNQREFTDLAEKANRRIQSALPERKGP
jgi:hypothetical protein